MTTTVYLSGPMTGLPEFNHPAFNAAAATLRERGYRVINPAEFTPPNDHPTHSDWMRVGIRALCDADAIAFLPGARHSIGAQCERTVAKVLGLLVVTV